jgi:hypothetical protein
MNKETDPPSQNMEVDPAPAAPAVGTKRRRKKGKNQGRAKEEKMMMETPRGKRRPRKMEP